MRKYLRLSGKGSDVVETERSKGERKRGLRPREEEVWGLWSESETLQEGLSILVRKAAANMYGYSGRGKERCEIKGLCKVQMVKH